MTSYDLEEWPCRSISFSSFPGSRISHLLKTPPRIGLCIQVLSFFGQQDLLEPLTNRCRNVTF